MATKLYSIESFHKMVRTLVREAIHEEMITELTATGAPLTPPASTPTTPGQPPPVPAAAKTGTKPPGGPPMQAGDNVTIPGTNMNLNQFLAAASKEQNLTKKKEMLAQASTVLTTLNTMEESQVIEPSDGGPIQQKNAEDENAGRPKVNTREPMHADLAGRIANLALYGQDDDEILHAVRDKIDGNSVTARWVKFMAKMAREGHLEEQMDGMNAADNDDAIVMPGAEIMQARRALKDSLKVIGDKFSELLDMFIAKGLKPADGAKMVRAMENILGNIQQDLQLGKDLAAVKARAAKAMAKSPLLKQWMPIELGGDWSRFDPMGTTIGEGSDHLKSFQFKKKDVKEEDASEKKDDKESIEEDKRGDHDDKVGPRDDQKDWNAQGKRKAVKSNEKAVEKEMQAAKLRSSSK